MKKNFKITLAVLMIIGLGAGNFPARAQNVIEIEPLFEYITAPEDLPGIGEKSDYIVTHFWDPFDFKGKNAVDQNALNHAMEVYTTAMRFADRDKVLLSADKLIEKISKNPVLQLQFTKAAEESMYSPRAQVWIDEVYLRFIDSIVNNKKIPDARKKRYSDQRAALGNTLAGNRAPDFTFKGKDGRENRYKPMSTPTILIFGDPGQMDWRMTRMKMETNTRLNQALERGKLNLLYIVSYPKDNWEKEVANYTNLWTVGYAPEISKSYDIRMSPTVYAIGSDGNIIMKNSTPEAAINRVLELTYNSNQ